jgi:hypothetical protein
MDIGLIRGPVKAEERAKAKDRKKKIASAGLRWLHGMSNQII